MDVTILYYSACVEDESFEQKIRDNILKHCGGLPIVSVTQKPIDLGKNICVGVHANCYFNEFRQIQIGLSEVKTPYVLTAEADVLYPPEYFRFEPEEPGLWYRYDNVWVLYARQENARYHFKGFSDGAQMVDRERWLARLDWALSGKPSWADRAIPVKGRVKTDMLYTWGDNAVVTFKTDAGVRRTTALKRSTTPRVDLPYWGAVTDLQKRMFT